MTSWTIDDLAEWPQWLEEVVDWHHREWLQTCSRVTWSPAQQAASLIERKHFMRLHLTFKPIPKTFVAHDATCPWGTCSLVYFALEPAKGTSVWLTNLYVLPRRRGQGVGRALLEKTLTWASMQRLRQIHLYTFDAKSFYLDNGWVLERQAWVRKREVDVLRFDLPKAI